MKSNIQRIFRAAVCLVLVCCLTVNISPIKAKAVVDPATAVAFDFAARSVIASAMRGLGVSKGNDATVFDGIVNDAVDALSPTTNFIVDGFAKVARFNLDSGATMFFLPFALIQSLWDWITGNGIVETSSGSYSADTTTTIIFNGNSYEFYASVDYVLRAFHGYASGIPYTVVTYYGSHSRVRWCGRWYDAYLHDNGYYYRHVTYSPYNYEVSGCPVLSIGSYEDIISLLSACASFGSSVSSVTTSYDLALEDVGLPDQTVEEAQPAWAENTVSVPGSVYGSDDDYVPSVPIAVAPDYEGTTNISQSDVQAGNSTWVDTETDTDIGTDTPPDALAGTVATTIAWHFISGLFDVFVPGFELISNAIEGIGALLKALPQTLKDVFGIDALLEKIGAIYETVVQGFLDTITGIRSIPQAIADVLAAIFVPSTDYITAKVEAICAKFPFMDSIISTGEYIRDSLSGSSGPPAIYVDLTLADGDIDYGEKTLLTDFSWYAPYKGTVDSVLGAALWAFFGWRVFLRLPGLISGADGYVGEIRTLSSRSSGAGGRKKED